jgi:hypothetical protein
MNTTATSLLCRAVLACMALAVVACSNQPPVPDWQINAHSATERALNAQLRGDARIANAEWTRARSEIARTARPDTLARTELLRCAALAASLQALDCPAFDALQADAAASEKAYARYLAGQNNAADVVLLPASQQAVARSILTQTPPPDLSGVPDPLARLVGAATLWRVGLASPEVVNQAVDTASAQGWRVPLLAWLNVQRQQALASGNAVQTQAISRRLQVVEQGGVMRTSQQP